MRTCPNAGKEEKHFRTTVWLLLFCVGLCQTGYVKAQFERRVRTSTDILMFVPGVAGAVATVALKDYEGTKQLALSGATALAANYLLEACIRKSRPDGSGYHSFPSTHSAAAFVGAAFVSRRYGWRYGVPAYLLSSYVAWGRVRSRRHDFWDVFGGAALGVGCGYLYTRPFSRNVRMSVLPAIPEGGGCSVQFRAEF